MPRLAGNYDLQAEPQPITVKTEDELNKLPSGTIFIAPDGSRKRKP
jgi:hypothetical protein